MSQAVTSVHIAEPRSTIQMHFPDGRTLEGVRGTSLETFLQAAQLKPEAQIVAGIVGGNLRELTFEVREDCDFVPVTVTSADGARIYRRSLVFLLLVATRELFPEADVAVDHSVSNGGYYCRIYGRPALQGRELLAIQQRMEEIVAQDEPILRRQVPLQEAIGIFQREGYEDKVRLLQARQKDYVSIYKLRGREDYFHGYMVPSTGYLKLFRLEHTPPGFTLRYPHRHTPDQIAPVQDFPKLRSVFQETGAWLQRLGVEDLGTLNQAVEEGRVRELILVAEALHDQKIAEIARRVVDQRRQVRLILIAGPSASGKTTFSRRLAIQLLALGLRTYPLEMDNYFVEREATPRDENGQMDFETVEALDRDLLSRQLRALLAGDAVTLPRYDFPSGTRQAGETVQLPKDAVILTEGIHGLNPDLLPEFPPTKVFRIYVSALTQLNLDRHNRVSTTDTRLIRRLVRDAGMRGHKALTTLHGWESVHRGEKRYIFPYQENADVIFNSALVYELAVLRPLAEPLLWQVPETEPERVEVKRLLALLSWFRPCSTEFIPDDSLIREFVGRSILEEFRVWRPAGSGPPA
ncbi:MAG: nucleoside kinase [Anaerolineales bacterium]|jgi:uridine kinase